MFGAKLTDKDISFNDKGIVIASQYEYVAQQKMNNVLLSLGTHKPLYLKGHPWWEFKTERYGADTVINSLLDEMNYDKDLEQSENKVIFKASGDEAVFNISMELAKEKFREIEERIISMNVKI